MTMSHYWQPGDFNEKLHKRLVQILTACALIVLADAIKNCPVDTGRLRASLAHVVDRENLSARIGTNVFYALFVFLGTYKMAARPILTNALEANKPEIRKRFGVK
jgi:HK97 gp10 family phage protein